MSLDAGGLAQMTYNNFASNGGLGLPGAGFASRGKGSGLKRLNLASPPKVSPIRENQTDSLPTPRTSRSHLLAGLRTAPKTPTGVPASAPYHQSQHRAGGLESSRFAQQNSSSFGNAGPQTAIGSGFPSTAQSQIALSHLFTSPEQVLAPPSLSFSQEDEGMDPSVLAHLVATEAYLQQRQQQLQQQLLSLTAQQFGAMNLGANAMFRQQQQHFPATPPTPQMGLYNQHAAASLPIQEVPGQPGVYLVFNQLTGQYSYMVDPASQQPQLASSPPPPTPSYSTSPPTKAETPSFRASVSPPAETTPNPFMGRSISPPKKAPTPPQDVTPLPPPSANAFRRGHKKVSSLAFNANAEVGEGPKSAFARSTGFPQTPTTGTFGPGAARAGEHPVRQPRGPPPFEELQAKPTTKHEGGKNFCTRQRRRAVHSLVRAGIERRGVRTGSPGTETPSSETEINFSISSDNDSDSVHSGSNGSLSGRPSIGSLRAVASGAIGSERKASRERLGERASVDACCSAQSVSSDEGGIGGQLVEVRVEEPPRRKTPMLVLTSAEKRKTSLS